jgi:hypothetical protein
MNHLTRLIHFFGPTESDLPEIKKEMTIENIKINGFTSFFFKGLLFTATLTATVALSRAAKKIILSSAITVIGLVILLNIVNYSMGTRVLYEKGIFVRKEGIFKNRKLVRGKVFLKTGQVQIGTFKQGKLVQGKAYFPTGTIYDGSWQNELFVKGTIVRPITAVRMEQGDFDNLSLVKGIRTYSDDRVLAGTFEKDQLVEGTISYRDGIIAHLRAEKE